MKHKINICFLFVIAATVAGCSQPPPPVTTTVDPHQLVQGENNLFLTQKTFDPWILTSNDPAQTLPAYLPSGSTGAIYGPIGTGVQIFHSGQYDQNGVIVSDTPQQLAGPPATAEYKQTLDLQHGTLSTVSETSSTSSKSSLNWPAFWKKSDIIIAGDPEAQQVTHAELFDLCGSLAFGTPNSVPPMGLSSNVYNGHIFWDAEIWMLPALLPQHPDLAKSIVDYRFKRLSAAESLAKKHGFAGAEYPWESAATGLEEAPDEFSHERHITGDVAFAAWQYYLWTGDKNYLSGEAWPVISATADYWASRATLGSDGKYHIANVVGPDETAGLVTDDAWTNAVAQYNLRAAITAATLTGHAAKAKWSTVANKMSINFDKNADLVVQFPTMDRSHQQAKQADAQMLIYPLNVPMATAVQSNTLDYYIKHTIAFGPAMTSSINAVIAAKLGRSQQALDLYHDSYRPFMRGPWDAFSEKRTKSDVYFTTGIGGSLQVLLYGFAGLNVVEGQGKGVGTLLKRSGDAALYCNPSLPPGWAELILKGVQFRGTSFTLDIRPGSKLTVTKE